MFLYLVWLYFVVKKNEKGVAFRCERKKKATRQVSSAYRRDSPGREVTSAVAVAVAAAMEEEDDDEASRMPGATRLVFSPSRGPCHHAVFATHEDGGVVDGRSWEP